MSFSFNMSNEQLDRFRPDKPNIEALDELRLALMNEANETAKQIAMGLITNAKKLTERQSFGLAMAAGVPYQALAELAGEKNQPVDPKAHGKLHLRLTVPIAITIQNHKVQITMLTETKKAT